MSSVFYFSTTLEEARSKFRDCVKQYHPGRCVFTSVEGLPDVIEIGNPHARNCLVVISGVHGVEGFGGSAVQLSLLREPLSLDSDTQLVLIHAVNQFGMQWSRRVNANNVDLNRNARIRFKQGEIGSAARYVYSTFSSRGRYLPWLFPSNCLFGLLRFGYLPIATAIAGGQTTFPRSIFYAGDSVQPEVNALLNFLFGLVRKFDRVHIVDLHSGIGKAPHVQAHGRKINYEDATRLFGPLLKPGHGKDLFTVEGSILDMVASRFPLRKMGLFTYECGTHSPLRILQALHKENHFHHADPGSSADLKAKAELREIFLPRNLAWRDTYITEARNIFSSCLDLMSASPRAREILSNTQVS